MPYINKIGKRFDRWVVLERLNKKTKGYYWFKCQCDCGTIKSVFGGSLRDGGTQSCGCLRLERSTTHGMTKTGTFKSWDSMLQRCTNPKAPDYPRYGGKGIKVEDEWLNFENFYKDMGERPEGTSLDRYPNNKGNYGPGNCRWATQKQQSKNKSVTRYLTYKGKTKLILDWSIEKQIPYDLLLRRVNRGAREDELFAPSRSKKVSRFNG